MTQRQCLVEKKGEENEGRKVPCLIFFSLFFPSTDWWLRGLQKEYTNGHVGVSFVYKSFDKLF